MAEVFLYKGFSGTERFKANQLSINVTKKRQTISLILGIAIAFAVILFTVKVDTFKNSLSPSHKKTIQPLTEWFE